MRIVERISEYLIKEDLNIGKFHRWLGKKEDEPITDSDVAKGLASSDHHVKKMAQFAQNMKESISESFSENDTVEYNGKKYKVWGTEEKMVIIVSDDEKERIKVLPQELKKVNG